MATLTLFLFGAPRLERDGAVVKIPRHKALALLAYLAATGQSHARDTLATLFWPDHSQLVAADSALRVSQAGELRWRRGLQVGVRGGG